MNYRKTLLPCILGCMALLSCTRQELSSGRQILFSVDDFTPEESTKTNCDPANNYAITWASNDTIGIFPREGFQEPFAIPANQVGKASASFDGGYWDVKEGLTYNAYYPFSTKNFQSADSKTTIPVVYTGQSQTGTQCNAGAFDYTYSDWTTATGGNVSFNFHHIGAFLVLSLPIPASTTYTKLTLTADSEVIPTAGTYDLTASKPAFVSTATASSLSMDLNSFTGTGGATSVFYMMLPPCDLSTATLTATLTSSAATTCTYTIESKTITSGKLFKITGKSKTSNVEGTVDDWVEEAVHEYVDLGLPSGTLWATCNVGASKPEEYGDYIAWGETSSKDVSYTWENYKYCQGTTTSMTKYCIDENYGIIDNKTSLMFSDDAAYTNWGCDWRMPSADEWNELITNCFVTFELVNEVKCCKLTSKKNDKYIYLPAGGYKDHASHLCQGTEGYYYSNTLSSTTGYSAQRLWFLYNTEYEMGQACRPYGLNIRPVYDPCNGHEYVDLGLTSGTLWATCNVGAAKPEEYGDYFAWGETTGYNSGKTGFSWSTYKWYNGSFSTLTKYCTNNWYGTVDNQTELVLEDDAARANWGGNWCIPSNAQQSELISECDWTWTTQNSVNGYKVSSKKNSNSIFLPAAGFREASSLEYAGSYGYYLLRSLSNNGDCYSSFCLNFNYLYFTLSNGNVRSRGLSVRPVFSE